MSSNKPSLMEVLTLPDPESILDVMNDCNCNEETAINLLRRSNDDPERAKHRHRTLMKYIAQSFPGPSQLLAPNRSTSWTNNPRPVNETDNVTDHSSDEEEYFDTPPTDEDCLPKPNGTGPRNQVPETTSAKPLAGILEESQHQAPLPPPPGPDFSSSSDSNMALTVLRGPASTELNLSSEEPHLNLVIGLDGANADHTSDECSGKKNGEESDETEWNFILPVIAPPPTLTPGVGEGSDCFNLPDLVGAMQHCASQQMIQSYLGYYEKGTVKRNINGTVNGFPAMFFAVATNNEWIIRTWIEYGGDVTVVHEASKVPLLAFAIMHSETIQADTTHIVATLLSLGASSQVIPAAFYTPYCQDLLDNGPDDEKLDDINDENKKWCSNAARVKLARTANLTQRYYLERAAKTKKPSIRHRQIALRRNAEALLGIPYFLIGQTMAANRLLQKLLSHIMVPSKRPLVLVFAGPSGHGKTELARRLGHLLSLQLEVVDCTIFNRESELFGPRHPYVGADRGSPLNNFLARNAGERCIVFLDEFEKTTSNIHQALLLPFDNGEYQDRRHLTKIDCSKTIWILATNALDDTIQNFCANNHQAIFIDDDQSEKLRLMKHLSKALKEDFLSKFDSPVTGRVSDFLPFLPFSPGEQAVVAHKYLLELGQKVRTAINLSVGPSEQLLGNVQLRIRRDASVCRLLAEAEYHSDLGARSLITAVNSVEDMLVELYLDVDKEITETDGWLDFVVDVNGGEVVANMVHPISRLGN